MKIRTAHRIARLGMVTLSAAALTSLGCSLLVNFDDSLIPVPDSGGEETGDGGADATPDVTTDAGTDAHADTTSGDADATSGDADATSADADATSADADATSGDADAGGDSVVDETDAGGDSVVDETDAGDATVEDTADATDAAIDAPATDAETSTDAVADTAPPGTVFVRAANLINAGISVDVCLASNTSGTINWSTTTPLMRSASSSSSGLAFEVVSGYFALTADTYQARLVAGGSTNCGSELNPGASTFTFGAFASGSYNTIAAIGSPTGTGATAESLTAYVDEIGTVSTASFSAKARLIHADPALASIDVGVVTAASPLSMLREWNGLAYGSFAPATSLFKPDTNGYASLTSALPSPVPVGITLHSATTVPLFIGELAYTKGDTLSLFAVQNGTLDVLFVCDDSVPALVSAGTLTNASCSEVQPPPPPVDAGTDTGTTDTGAIDAGTDSTTTDTSATDTASTDTGSTDTGSTDGGATDAGTPTSFVRIAHLSVGGPSVAICVAPVSASPPWASIAPQLSGAGVSFEQVTGYLAVPSGAYEIRLVTPGASDCGTELIPGATTFTLPVFTANQYATVAAIGVVGHTDATAFQLVTLTDEVGEAPTGAAINARFYHADPTLAGLDIGVITAPGTPPTIVDEWTSVAYASDDPNAMLAFGSTDSNGYVGLPALGASPLAVAASLDPSGALAFTGLVPFTGTPTLSVFALNDGTSNVFFVCDDTTPAIIPTTFFSSCTEESAVPTPPADAGTDSGAIDSGADTGPVDTGADVAVDAGPTDAATPMQNTRFAQLATGYPALDLCIAPTSVVTSTGFDWSAVTPQAASAGFTTGLPLETITAYQTAPVTSYTVRLVTGGALIDGGVESCSVEAATGSTFTLPALPAGAYATLVAITVPSGGGRALSLVPIVDEVGPPVAGTFVNVRVFNASQSLGAQDVGLLAPDADGGFALTPGPAWFDLPYGSATAASYPVLSADTLNYVNISAATATAFGLSSPVNVGADPTGTSTLDLTAAIAVTETSGATLSAFILNNGTKNVFYVCDDTTPAAAASILSSCSEF